MSIDVMSLLRERKLASLKRSIASSENHEKRVSQNANRAKAVINNTSPYAGSEHFEEYILRDKYMRALEDYQRKPVHAYVGQPFTPKGLALWKRVAKAWRESGVDADVFIQAQFTYFHNVFRKAPTAQQLTTEGAVLRAISVRPEKVSTNDIPAQIDLGELFKRCEKQMTEIMRAQKLTREEVYRNLVLNRLVMFPEVYLNADPIWKKVKNGHS